MKRKPLAETFSLVVKAAAPATAVATSLAAPLAQAASGDLDPTFADHGRLAEILGAGGAVYAIEARDGGRAFIAGADFDYGHFCYFYYSCSLESSSYTDLLDERGLIDATYQPLEIDGIEAFSFARQPDGKVVAAGHRVLRIRPFRQELVIFRLGADGSLDAEFGEGGVMTWSAAQDSLSQVGRSVVIDPDGRIVVAGAQYVATGNQAEGRLVVLRLLEDGSLDSSFGEAGVYQGAFTDYGGTVRLVRTGAGYRVASAGASGCEITGLDADGVLDPAFGTGGVAVLTSGDGDAVDCEALESLADGKLLVAGGSGDKGYVARLLPNGAPDSAFVADAALPGSMTEATAVQSTADGKVFVGGDGIKGASIMRLLATGELDTLFGDGGRTWIDLQSRDGAWAIIRDIAVGTDGSVLAGGGDLRSDNPFVVRLMGDAGGSSAGIVGFSDGYSAPKESDGHAIVRVRRSGGSDGEASVGYRTIADGQAIAGEDFTAASGTLHWSDGDSSVKEIVVSIAADGGPAEAAESFRVALDRHPQFAGLGAQYAYVEIQPDGSPAGQIEMVSAQDFVAEAGVAEVQVTRNYYKKGEVSVTVNVEGITATGGDDYLAEPVTLTWGPDQNDTKTVQIEIVNDSARENAETFRVALSDPTGGAILGPNSDHVIEIVASDAPRPPPRDGGGGGASGILSLLLLGFVEACRAGARGIRRRMGDAS